MQSTISAAGGAGQGVQPWASAVLALRAFPLACLAGLFAVHFAQGLFVRGDAFQAYAVFNAAYGNFLSAGEFPQWLPLAAYGSPAEPYMMTFLGPFQILAIFAGTLLQVTDAWTLFFCTVFLESVVLVLGAQLFAAEVYESELTASAVGAWVAVSLYWSAQIFWSHRVLVFVPLMLLFAYRFHRTGDLRQLCRAGLAVVTSLIGGLAYVAPMYALLGCAFLLGLRLCDRARGFARLVRPGRAALFELALLLALAGLYAALFANAFAGAGFTSPDRDPVTGAASLDIFLTYGGPALDKLPDFLLGRWVRHFEFLFYLGVGATGLAVFALLRERRGVFLALCCLCLFLFLLALGPQGGLGYAAYWFPGMNRFRHLAFLLPLVRLLLLFLAGFGLDRLLREDGQGRAKALACLTGSALALIVLKHALPLGNLAHGLSLGAFVPELGFGLILLARLAGRLVRTRPQALGLALALAVALELGAAHYLLLRDTWSFFDPREVHEIGDGLDAAQVQPPRFIPARAAELMDHPRVKALVNLALRQPVNNFALQELVGADPCAPIFRIDYAMPEVLALLERGAPGALALSNLERNPRTFLSGAHWRQALDQPWFREACGCDGGKLALEAPDGQRRDVSGSVRSFSDNRLVAAVDGGTQGGTLYYADAFHPRWRASVDGQPVPVTLAREAFKAVAVPPGEHLVALSFYDAWREWARRGLGVLGALAVAHLLSAGFRELPRKGRKGREAGQGAATAEMG